MEAGKMADKRSGKDRRARRRERRCGCTTKYNGPEKRAIKYRRSDNDRREKDVDLTSPEG